MGLFKLTYKVKHSGLAGRSPNAILNLDLAEVRELVRLVQRTIAILSELDLQAATLNKIHKSTGIPRATLLRILGALIDEGLVRRSVGQGIYSLTHKTKNLGHAASELDNLAECAADLLRAHASVVKWPTDVLMLHANQPCLVVAETNRPRSPFPVKLHRIGRTVPLLLSAAGRTYLAYLSDTRRDTLLRRLIRSSRGQPASDTSIEDLSHSLTDVRAKGYGTRSRYYRGGEFASGNVEHDGLLALAVPVFKDGSVFAVANTQWDSSAYGEEKFAEKYLDHQLTLAVAISEKYSKIS